MYILISKFHVHCTDTFICLFVAHRNCSPYPGGFIAAVWLESPICGKEFIWLTEEDITTLYGPITTSGGFGDIVNYTYFDLTTDGFPDLDTCIRDPNRFEGVEWVWNNQFFNTMTYEFNFANLAEFDKCCGNNDTDSPTMTPIDTTEPPIPTPNPVDNPEPTDSPTRIPIDINPPSIPPTPANCSCKVDICAHGMCDVELFISQDGGSTFNSLAITSDWTEALIVLDYCIDADTVLRFEVEHSQYVT